jgi:hypothetical protein
MVSRAQDVLDAAGALTDTAVEGQLRKFLDGFVSFIKSRSR